LLLVIASVAAALAFASVAHAAPANDAFSKATVLPAGLPSSQAGSNLGATKQAGEPNHAGNAGGHSVWYSWTPSSSRPVGIHDDCFGSIEALIAVYTGAAVNALTPVASNESTFPSGCFFSESPEAEFEATAGTTYWIAVDGRDGAEGSFELLFDAPPANDDFADAEQVDAELPQTVFGTTRLSGKEAGEPDHAGDPGGHSVWYSWTPSSSEQASISTCSSFGGLDAVLAVYTGATLGTLDEVAGNDDGPLQEGFPGCRSTDSEVVLNATAATPYWIAVDGFGGTAGRFSLRIRGRPENDDFASPKALGAGLPSYAFQASNEMATKEIGEPDHTGNAGGHSVWFSWTPSSSGSVAVSTCSHESYADTLLAVYTGSTLAGLTPVASNDDGSHGQCRETDSEARFDATAGTTYRIAVDGKDGDQGRFDLSLEAPPGNDDFASADDLSPGLPISKSGTTRLATKQVGEPDHAGEPGGDSVWYSWTPSDSGPVTISTCPYFELGPDTLLAVYTGSSVGNLTPVAGNDDSPAACKEMGSEVEIEAVAGTTYRIAVDGKEGSEGIFSLDLNGRPANDDFASPVVLGPEPMTAGDSTVFATKEAGEPDHAGEPGGHSLWYSWTPSSGGPVDITACGHNPSVDTLLAVYTGTKVSVLTPVASNDDAVNEPANELCESPDLYSEVEFDVAAGTTYRIAIDTKDGVGRFGLAFERGPENDDFADAASLSSSLPSYGSAVTKLATKQGGEPDHAGDSGGHSVWYSWTPAKSGPVEISACANYGNLETLLAVYTGSSLASLTPVVSDGDGSGGGWCHSSGSEAQFTAAAGTTYRIAIDGKGGSTGAFQLSLEGTAANDDFGKAQPLGGGLPVQESFASNRFATKQAGEPDHAGEPGGASIWFKWTSPRSGPVSVDTCGSSFDTLLAVYTGASLETLSPVQGNDDSAGKCAPQSKLSFNAVANTVYRIAVDGKVGEEGSVELRVDSRPKNDDFDKAEKIPGSLGWYWPGSTLLATKQAGEPDHAGDSGGHSVWYSWTPAKSAEVELDACTGTFDPLLAAYTGAAVDDLSPLPTTDVGPGECDEGGSIGFAAVAGTTYRLAIDGREGDEGHFELHFRSATTLARLLTVSKAGAGTGSVVSSPSGLNCGSTCGHQFEDGTAVTLTASPAAASSFGGWSGGACSGTGPCQLVLNADATVTATFDALPAGGEAGGNGGGSTGASPAPPSLPPVPKPRRCKQGFKKKIVHGKPRCVKRKHRTHRPGRQAG
jgi:hypothetical protein